MRYVWSEALAKRRRYFSRLDWVSSREKYPGSLIADMKMAGCSERSRQRAEVPDFIAPITNRLGDLAMSKAFRTKVGQGVASELEGNPRVGYDWTRVGYDWTLGSALT
jgi:hypothetical protein